MGEQELENILEQVRARLQERNVSAAIALIEGLHPADQAETFVEAMQDLPEAHQKEIIPQLEPEQAADILEELPEEQAAELASALPSAELADVLDEMPPAEAADILGDLSPEQAASALREMDQPKDVRSLMKYRDDSVGGRMSPEFFALKADLSCEEAIQLLRQRGPSAETPYYLYITNQAEVLNGVVGLRTLIVSAPEARLKDVMEPAVVSVRAQADQEEAANVLRKYKLLMLPVLDEAGKLVGVLRSNDVLDVIEEEATEDVYNIAGVSDADLTIWSPTRQHIRKRLPWLIVNLGTAFLAASVVSQFQSTIAQLAILAVFQGIVAGQGGNAATQTLALMVRGIALGIVQFKDLKRVLRKEMRAAIIHGLIVGTAVGFGAWLWVGKPLLGVIIAVAMVGNMLAAAMAGTLIPLGLKLLRLDPAIASAVVVTTVTDCVGFGLFLGLASLALSHLG